VEGGGISKLKGEGKASGLQIQIILSLLAIVGAAGLALLCDLLKKRNEQLREAMVELRVRREENEQKGRTGRPATRPNAKPKAPGTKPTKPVGAPPKPPVTVKAPQPAAAPAAIEQPPIAVAPTPLVREAAAVKPDPAAVAAAGSAEPLDAMKTTQPLTEWLIQRAVARAAQKAADEIQTTASPAIPTVSEPIPVTVTVKPVSEPAPAAVPVQLVAEAAPALREESKPSRNELTPTVEPVVINEALWQSLFGGSAAVTTEVVSPSPVAASQPEPKPKSEPVFELIQCAGASAVSHELSVPAGLQDLTTLNRLIESRKLFNGLVVAVSVDPTDVRVARSEELMQTITTFLCGLLGERDFACRAQKDEFVLIFPGLRGAEAQRQLSNLSERLWDYQLRAMGSFSILFSLGGVDVHQEPLGEALVCANERMYQTRRNRKTFVMPSPNQRRKAV
jgi:hypothetical protein